MSRLRLLGARERTAFVPKQLGLEQLIGQCRAVDGDERAVFPRRRLVNEPGDDFLAGARLALEKDCGLSRCHAHSRREHTLPRWRPIRSRQRERDNTRHQLNSSRAMSAS